jgi:hypothetical protein
LSDRRWRQRNRVRDHGQVNGVMRFAWLMEMGIPKGSINCVRRVTPGSALRLVIVDNFKGMRCRHLSFDVERVSQSFAWNVQLYIRYLN